MKRKFDRNMFGLLANNAMHNIINIYMNTFLVAHLLTVNSGNFFTVALYYLISYVVLMTTYVLFSFTASKYSKNKQVVASVVLSCLVLIYMASLGNEVANQIVLISLIFNVISGMYWSAINSLSNEIIKGKKLLNYNTYNSIVSNITSIIIPIAFGSIIDTSSLSVIAIFIVIVGLLECASTFFIRAEKHPHKLDYKGYFDTCYNGTNKKCFKLLYATYIVYGCRASISTLITMLIVLTFKTNTSLGAISSIISCFTILALIVSKKFKREKMTHVFSYIIGVVIASLLLLQVNISKPTIVIFNFCFATLLSIVDRPTAIKRSGLIRAINHKEYIIEHQAVVEVLLNVGRICFYLILLIASFSQEIWVYKILLLFSTICVLGYGILCCHLEKEYNKILIEREFKKQIGDRNENDILLPSYSNPNNDAYIRHSHR